MLLLAMILVLIYLTKLLNSFYMEKSFFVFYQPSKGVVSRAVIQAETVKQALTRFNYSHTPGIVCGVLESGFDSSLFNL